MNLDDLLDYAGYDSPDYESEKEEPDESDSDGDDREEEGAGEVQEDDEEGAGGEVDGDRRTNKRKPEGRKLGDIEAEWVQGEKGKKKVGEHRRPCSRQSPDVFSSFRSSTWALSTPSALLRRTATSSSRDATSARDARAGSGSERTPSDFTSSLASTIIPHSRGAPRMRRSTTRRWR